MIKKTYPFIFLLLISLSGFGQWQTNYEKAIQQSKEETKFVLLYFSGSDWCIPCIQLKKKIFETPEFETFSKESLVLLNADFPRRKANRLSKEQEAHNEMLAEKYNQSGIFPITLLLNPEGKIIKKWEGMPKLTSTQFINEVKDQLPYLKKADLLKKEFKATELLMGSRFEFTVQATDERWAQQQIAMAINEVKRIEKKISSWDVNSETTRINNNAGKQPVVVSEELCQLIERSLKVSALTQGAFDITYGSIDKSLWHFDETMTTLPSNEVALKSVHLINYQNVIVDKNKKTVFLKEKGMKIGFGGIGKGYAAEKVKTMWIQNGVEAGIVNAGGDLITFGDRTGETPWTIGIANPELKHRAFSWMEVKDMAVVTSGNYEKFVEVDGIKYSHIIDPRTGFPASGIKSVTIMGKNAELADALATSVFIMGKEAGMYLIEQLNGVNCIIVDDKDEVIASQGIQLQYVKK